MRVLLAPEEKLARKRAAWRRWYERNKEAHKAYMRQNYQDKREERIAKMRAWNENNRERKRAHQRARYAKRRAAMRACAREYEAGDSTCQSKS